MLKRIDLCMNHARRIKRYRHVAFKPGLNLLIGPNGTGKSTLLQAISQCPFCQRVNDGETELTLFDTKTMDPSNPDCPSRGYIAMTLRSRAVFSSHGEILQAAFAALPYSPNTCILLDEPETGQDFENVLKLRKAMDRAIVNGAQIICASHHILFWERAHFIELKRGYRDHVTKAICELKCEGSIPAHPVS